MNHSPEPLLTRWHKRSSLPAGSIAALAATPGRPVTVFAGTRVGLFRSAWSPQQDQPAWERLDGAPVGILALAVSPGFTADRSVLAGAEGGVWFSDDGGDHWRVAGMPLSNSTVLCLAHSPAFEEDGILLAGTLEDGVLYSDTRGEQWSSRGFGLLDPTVLAIAFSPAFRCDGTAFVGTDTSLYKTYNHARAWKPLPFPAEAGPVLSLAVSPHFPADQTLFAGSEAYGLFRSTDGGMEWSRLPLPAESVNGLCFSGGALLAATGSGLFVSGDGGDSWEVLLELPDVISLAVEGGLALVGTVDDGLWLQEDAGPWQNAAGLAARSVTGCVLADDFARSQRGYLYGPQEGIWRTTDGGGSWQEFNEGLPTLDILDLALRGDYLAAATPEGVLLSADGGENWRSVYGEPAARLAFSANGRMLAVSAGGRGVRISGDLGQTWEPVAGPWDKGGEVLALGISAERRLHVALLEGLGETVSIWQGEPGAIAPVVRQPAGKRTVAAFWLPPDGGGDYSWYAAVGRTVWKAGAGGSPEVFGPELKEGDALIALAGSAAPGQETLFASTGRLLFQHVLGSGWQRVADFERERAIAVIPSPDYGADQTVFALLLGGSFYCSKGVAENG